MEDTTGSEERKRYEPGMPTLSRIGRAFLANPDLPRRLQLGAALNEPDPKTFYGGGAAGYITYPALS